MNVVQRLELDPQKLQDMLAKHRKWLQRTYGGVRLDLSGADLRGADLSGAVLRSAKLSGTNFARAIMIGTDLQECDLFAANLDRADLSHANLENADLRGAFMRGCRLNGANMKGVDLRGGEVIKPNHVMRTLYASVGLEEDVSDQRAEPIRAALR